ncbi:MAG: copper resistance protein NlpE N-terminal domain-containing protein [Rikenella sp.]|nr:copper resistance protein NlpE N-terminal domain-containing protein [Rikenella sp.]
MKRVGVSMICAVALGFAAAACGSRGTGTVSHRYVGTLPAADGPGIVYDLTLSGPAGDSLVRGDFSLTMTYIEGDKGRDVSFESAGRWTTLRGIPDDAEAVVLRLISSERLHPDTLHFLSFGDRLELLGMDLQRVRTGVNHTLVLKE